MARPRLQASFVTSAARSEQLPAAGPRTEIAVVGRSNVGKSSLLGRLLGAPTLVRTSRTPGRTQLMNLFALGNEWAFVDLPGYGYAKLSLKARAQLSEMLRDYLFGPREFTGTLCLLDARREEVTATDRDMVAELLQIGRPVLVVVTKLDLVPKPRQRAQLAKVAKSLGVPVDWVCGTSSKSGAGLDEVWKRLKELRHEQAEAETTA